MKESITDFIDFTLSVVKVIIFIFTVIFLATILGHGQSIDKISAPCSQFSSLYAFVSIGGNITYTPCAGKKSIFTGDVDFSGATVTGLPASGDISGNGAANFFPVFSAAKTIVSSPYTWDGNQYQWDNADGNASWVMYLHPNDQVFTVGESGATSFYLDNTQGKLDAPFVRIGNAFGSTANITVEASTNTIYIGNTSSPSIFVGLDVSKINNWIMNRTIAGAAGDTTINKPAGIVQIENGSASVTVTNSTVTVNSIVMAVKQSNTPDCKLDYVAPAAGSFTIVMDATCGADTKVAFWVSN